MPRNLGSSVRKHIAYFASTALIVGVMTAFPTGVAQSNTGDLLQVASTVYEYPDLAPGVLSVSNDQWRDTRVDCRLITETADFYTTMSQANSWLDIDNVVDCDVAGTAPTRSGNPAFYQLSAGQYVALTRKSNNETLTIWWGSAPIVPRLAVSSASISGIVDEAIVPITVTATNFTPNLFSVSPQLPSGLTIDSATGAISGSPESSQPATSYTITGTDGSQEATATITIGILAEPPLTVTFKQDVGMLSRSILVDSGQSIVLPKTQNAQGQEGVTLSGRGSVVFPVVKDSHLFGGWYSDSEFTDESFIGLPGDAYAPVASVELHAKWVPARDICFQVLNNTIRDLVTFPANWYPWPWEYPITPCAGTTRGTQVRVPSDVPFELPIPTRSNAGFHGWYSTQQSTDGSSTSGTLRGRGGAVHQVTFSSGNVLTYHSQWQTQDFRINFDPGSGVSRDSFGSASCEAVGTNQCGVRWRPGDSIASDGRAAVVAPSPTRDGWRFNGWFTSSSGGTRLGGGGDLIAGAANDTVRAQWTQLALTRSSASLQANQGSAITPWTVTASGFTSPVFTVDPALPAGLTLNPATGSINGTPTQAQSATTYTVTATEGSDSASTTVSITIVAPATVTFDVGLGAGNSPAPVSASVGSTITLPRPTRPQHAFIGWFNQPLAGDRVGDSSRSYVVTGDETLYARWLDTSVPPIPPTPNTPVTPPASNRGVIVDENGQDSVVDVTPNPGNTGVSVGRPASGSSAGFDITLEGVDAAGDPVELSPEGLLILSEDRRVAAAGSGFTPEAPVAFYLISPGAQVVSQVSAFGWLSPASGGQILLGMLTVDGTGDFAGTLILPDGLSSGDYLVQAVGPTSDGEILSITLGVRVEASATGVRPDPAIPASEPIKVLALPGDQSARVMWSPPQNSGDFAVTTYQVVGSPGGGCLVQAPALSCEITGLTNGVEYTFRVRALTGAGWSAYSQPSLPVTPGVGSAASIMVTGTRVEVRGRAGVQVRGVTTGLNGVQVTPRIRLAKEDSYSFGVGVRTIGDDGAFVWERVTSRWVYVYFIAGGVKSNRIVLR